MLIGNLMRTAGKDSKYARHMWVMKAIFDEVVDEMVERDLEELEQWLAATGMVIRWIGTGEISDLPPDFQQMIPGHLLAISAPSESTSESD